MNDTNNIFSLQYYESIIVKALQGGYEFCTIEKFLDKGCPKEKHFILRHDLDVKPLTLKRTLKVEDKYDIKSTIFVRVTANEYNLLSYPVFRMIKDAHKNGHEVGLHTSFVEYSKINKLEPLQVLEAEVNLLKNFFKIKGIAPHRDLNYAFNSLPFIEQNWQDLKRMGLEYQAYERRILDSVVYINEGFNPHLCWRGERPEEVIKSKSSICMLTHNHWWYEEHPFEDLV